jgi:hypothetical protein
MYGNIIGYGTKEESDESYADYEEQPYYTVVSIEIYKDTILAKVWNKGSVKFQMVEFTLNQDMQLDSYSILSIGG